MNYDEDFDDETDSSNEFDEIDGGSSLKDVKNKSKSRKKEDDDDDDVIINTEEDDYFTEDPNWKGTRYFQLEGRTVRVLFSKFFGKSAKVFEEFITSCVSKKAYHKMMRLFVHSNNVILNYNKKTTETFIYKYYCIKHNIDMDNYSNTSHQQFVNAIVNLFDVGIMNEIRKYVNTYYIPTGNEKYEENKRTYDPAITFLDYHIKILFVVSNMTHFIIPLCLEYLRAYRNTPTNALLVDAFTNLFPIAQMVDPEHLIPLDKDERPSDVYQKLYSFVERKVNDSLKSDEVMWERQTFLGVNHKSTTEDIVNKLVTNIVPEYSFKGNTMHLNVSVVRKSIQDYTLRKKDPFNINCFMDIDSNTSDDDNAIVSESEQFDSFNAKHDEFPLIIGHTFMSDTVNKILMRKGITLNPVYIEYYTKNLTINDFQRFCIMSSFHRYFGGTENMYSMNQENWIKLMLAVVEMFNRSGPETAAIAKYVTAKRERHYVSKKEARVSRAMLLNDPLYKHLINSKYKNVKNIIENKNNFIENKITYLISNEFSFNTPIKEINGMTIPRDETEIIKGVLKVFDSQIY